MNYGFQVYLITIKLVQEEELSTCWGHIMFNLA
jgi:hypothetical protein